MSQKISVLGAGHWGLALASVLANNCHDVLVYARKEETTKDINQNHHSNYFKDKVLNERIKATSSMEEAISYSNIILIAIPVVTIYDTLIEIAKQNPDKIYLFTSKGLYKGQSMSTLFYKQNKDFKLAVLSGPSFSEEVMDQKKTAVVIASKDEEIAKKLQKLFTNHYFRAYTATDIIGVEYCAAIKNVFAIVCGMVDGNQMGCNAKNAILTRGLSEVKRIIDFIGGDIKTLFGLAGIGDIMLTCNSLESRNYSYGFNYEKNKNTNCIQNGTIEGLNTIKEIYHIAKDNEIDMPIINSLYKILFMESTIKIEAEILMGRDLKSE